MMKIVVFICACVLLTSCSSVEVKRHEIGAFPHIPEDAKPAPISFRRVQYDIPVGTTIGATSPRILKDGPFACNAPYGQVQTGLSAKSFPADDQKRAFNQVMRTQGYDVTGDVDRIFDSYDDESRATYLIGGRIIDIKFDLCAHSYPSLFLSPGTSGEAEMTIEWTVRDALQRRNVLKLQTSGSAESDIPNQEGLSLLLNEAFSVAAHNLGGNQEFRDLIIMGKEPAEKPESFIDPYDLPLDAPEATQSFDIDAKELRTDKVNPKNGEEISESVVLIETATGHGSGFFISQNLILTNADVIEFSDQQRITIKGKKEKVTAETLRLDRLRNVALIRLQNPLEKTNITPLPIRTDKPHVSEEVYAIGTPVHRRLQNSLTKGILSAHRYDRREKQWYIQADVDTHPGNSGGPLLDEHGNIIGMTVAGYTDGANNLSGLNLFIPILDALTKLSVNLTEINKTEMFQVTDKPQSIIKPEVE